MCLKSRPLKCPLVTVLVCDMMGCYTHSYYSMAEVDTSSDLSLGSCNVKLDWSNCPLQVMDVPAQHDEGRGGKMGEYVLTLPLCFHCMCSSLQHTGTRCTSMTAWNFVHPSPPLPLPVLCDRAGSHLPPSLQLHLVPLLPLTVQL